MSETATKAQIHRDQMGCYHPAPDSEIAWTVNDTRRYIDSGPYCDKCGACECDVADTPESHHVDCKSRPVGKYCETCPECETYADCIGLSFAYHCLDGGEVLCQQCFDKQSDVEVVSCDC